MKMPLFSGMIRGMKCSWIKRLLSKDYQRKKLAGHFVKYKAYQIEDIIQFKLDLDHVAVSSPFYHQVLKYWFELYSVQPIDTKEVMRTPLWHNKNLMVNHKPILYKQWHDSGITCIYDLISAGGILKSREELEYKYDIKIKQMEYNSLTHAIPKQWLRMRYDKYIHNFDHKIKVKINDKQKDIEKLTCKEMYWEYVRKHV